MRTPRNISNPKQRERPDNKPSSAPVILVLCAVFAQACAAAVNRPQYEGDAIAQQFRERARAATTDLIVCEQERDEAIDTCRENGIIDIERLLADAAKITANLPDNVRSTVEALIAFLPGHIQIYGDKPEIFYIPGEVSAVATDKTDVAIWVGEPEEIVVTAEDGTTATRRATKVAIHDQGHDGEYHVMFVVDDRPVDIPVKKSTVYMSK